MIINVYNLGRVSVQFNDGSGIFSEHTSITAGSKPHTTAMGDFNDDGALDLAVANDGSNNVTILYNNTPVSVDDNSSNLIEGFMLSQNYPNPFNPTTKIKYTIPTAIIRQAQSEVFASLNIYDVLGNEIATLVNEEKSVGSYQVEFDGAELTSGIYFYRLRAGNFTETKKMLLLK